MPPTSNRNKKNTKIYPGYPYNVLSPSTPYVYFDSLLHTEDGGKEIYNAVKPYFNQHITDITTDTIEIDAALAFLREVIRVESSKETAFINYFSKKFKDNKDLQIPSLTSDWTPFVQAIQTIVPIGTNNLINLQNEKKRLETHQVLAQKEEKESWEIIKTNADKVGKHMESLYKFMQKGSSQSNGEKVMNLILNKFADKLLQVDKSGELIFNKSTLFSLITMIQGTLMHQYNDITFDQKSEALDIKKLENILNNNENNFVSEMNNFLDRVQKLPFLGQDITNSLGFGKSDEKFSKIESQQIQQIIKQQQNLNQQQDNLAKILQSYYNKGFITDKAFSLVTKGNAYAEVQSLFNLIMQHGAIYGHNTGSAGAKPDNLLALLSIDLNQLDLSNQTILDALNNIHEAMSLLDAGLQKNNDLAYYETRQKQWNQARDTIDAALKTLSQEYKELIQCFIIEDSTKNYTTLYSTQSYGRTNSEFHGGSLGPNIQDQINKLDTLYQAGGLSKLDTKWLIAAAINMGTGMIARKYKSSLERYLATFACILLFDDQINIATEAAENIKNENGASASSVQKIHLFSLNDGYYPISYILQITYDNLQKAYNNTKSLVVDGSGAQVRITGFVEEPQTAYSEKDRIRQWKQTRNTALASTKIKLSFLTNFLNVLNALYPQV